MAIENVTDLRSRTWLEKLHMRTYESGEEIVLVIGSREGIAERSYQEAEFVFRSGELVQVNAINNTAFLV